MVLSPGQIILVFFIVAAFFSISFLIFSCECINYYFRKRYFIKRSTKTIKLKKSSKKKQIKASYCTVAPSNVTKNYKILRTLYDSIHDWINTKY